MRPYYDLGDRRDEYGGAGEPGRWGYRLGLTRAVFWITAIAAAAFVLTMVISSESADAGDWILRHFGFTPEAAIVHGWVWQFITYNFLHADIYHIFFNMWIFLMMGGMVEPAIGTRRFLALFFISGIAGALCQAALGFYSARAFQVTTIGASASIMGVAMACGMLFPRVRVLLFFIIPMTMRTLVWIVAGTEIFFAFGQASQEGKAMDNVAHLAHLGGLGAGYLFIKLQQPVGWRMHQLWWRLTGRFRGMTGGPKVTHIDDDAKYREEVDRLLDKIFKEGTQSLSKEEAEFLKDQSKRYKR